MHGVQMWPQVQIRASQLSHRIFPREELEEQEAFVRIKRRTGREMKLWMKIKRRAECEKIIKQLKRKGSEVKENVFTSQVLNSKKF